jgi:hypothetical protein
MSKVWAFLDTLAFFFLLGALGYGCARDDTKTSEPLAPSPEIVAKYNEAVDRVLDERFTPLGWVVSRQSDGSAEHLGDSLIWTGMLLGTLPCERAAKVSAALRKMIGDERGGLYRYPTLPDDVSQDGALGFYWGLARHLKRCPAEKEAWLKPMRLHQSLGAFELNRDSTAQLLPEFNYAQDITFSSLGLGDQPSSFRLSTLATEGKIAALDAKLRERACFRVHITLLAMDTAEVLGDSVPQTARDEFCATTKGMELPSVDHFCGRGDELLKFIDAFKEDEWEMRLQRCPAWESPDGDGSATPGVDLLVALTLAYGL